MFYIYFFAEHIFFSFSYRSINYKLVYFIQTNKKICEKQGREVKRERKFVRGEEGKKTYFKLFVIKKKNKKK